MDYEIGPARPSEAPRIAGMSRGLVEGGLRWRWRPGAIARQIARADTEVVVARKSGRVFGFGIMQFGDDEAHLVLFAVHSNHARRGVGRALMAWLEKMAETAMLETISLEVRATNEGGRSFYRSLGYREIGCTPRYYDGVEDAIRMERSLLPITRGVRGSADR